MSKTRTLYGLCCNNRVSQAEDILRRSNGSDIDILYGDQFGDGVILHAVVAKKQAQVLSAILEYFETKQFPTKDDRYHAARAKLVEILEECLECTSPASETHSILSRYIDFDVISMNDTALKVENLRPQAVRLREAGDEYKQSNDLRKAEECYKESIEYDFTYYVAYRKLGKLYERQGRDIEAIEYYVKAIAYKNRSDTHYEDVYDALPPLVERHMSNQPSLPELISKVDELRDLNLLQDARLLEIFATVPPQTSSQSFDHLMVNAAIDTDSASSHTANAEDDNSVAMDSSYNDDSGVVTASMQAADAAPLQLAGNTHDMDTTEVV